MTGATGDCDAAVLFGFFFSRVIRRLLVYMSVKRYVWRILFFADVRNGCA